MSTPVLGRDDLVVVGAGSGGYVAGIRAAPLGMTVAIIEERSRGGGSPDARVRGVPFLMRKNKIAEIDGRGRFKGSHTVDVQLRDGGTTSLRFDNAIIATGSRVRMLPGVTLSDNIVTYEQQILDATIPESIVIIGAGGIGMEFAYILNSYGVDVQILQNAHPPLP